MNLDWTKSLCQVESQEILFTIVHFSNFWTLQYWSSSLSFQLHKIQLHINIFCLITRVIKTHKQTYKYHTKHQDKTIKHQVFECIKNLRVMKKKSAISLSWFFSSYFMVTVFLQKKWKVLWEMLTTPTIKPRHFVHLPLSSAESNVSLCPEQLVLTLSGLTSCSIFCLRLPLQLLWITSLNPPSNEASAVFKIYSWN